MNAPPSWHRLSHHDRYRKLQIVRRRWCRRCLQESNADIRGRAVVLDGTWIDDVPSFYLALGEAINGPNGYFGACLDALSDCLCGGFGVLPPLTIRLREFEKVRNALDGRAWRRFRAEGFREAVAKGEDELSSYFDAIIRVLEEGGAHIVPEPEEMGESSASVVGKQDLSQAYVAASDVPESGQAIE